MIEVSLIGIDKAIQRLDHITSFIIPGALYGIEESITMLEQDIKNKAYMEGREDYAEAIESGMNWSMMYGIVGPTLDYAPVDEMGDVARYIHTRCPWWRYLEPKLRKRVIKSPILQEVWATNSGRIRDIIIKSIKEWIK